MSSDGHIILVNGASGSGKTTLCRQLTNQLHFPYIHISMDRFYEGLTQQPLSAMQRACLPTIYQGFLASVAAFADTGNRTLLDIVLINRAMKESAVRTFSSVPTYLVGLNCSQEILLKRNGERRRRRNLCTEQVSAIHEDMFYDLTLDTEQFSLGHCADQIIRYLDCGQKPTALTSLKREFDHGS
ncbi:MAG: AAA family ATPase [Proteobacteria bacterium]|nr:AAA family ATPase [Pseudomonadota bacterium]MBU1057270.1 AAA family ATPase [Pseudomonadota bacterium]